MGTGIISFTCDDVTEDVDSIEEEERSETGEAPANTSFMDSSSARCKSKYTRKLLDAHPPVRIISESVAPLFRIAVAAPRLKQWGEYRSESTIFNLARTALKMREKFFP